MVKLLSADVNRVAAWLDIHDPEKRAKLFESGADEARSLQGIGNPAVSGGVLTGNGISPAQNLDNSFQAIINNPEGAQGQLTPKQYQKAVDIFKENPISGCSSVLTIARASANFNPLAANVTGQAPKFLKYLDNVASAPFFEILYSNTSTFKRESEDYNSLIEGIANLFGGVTTQDLVSIKNGLTEMAKSATSRKETQQSQTMYAQNTLQTSGNDVTVLICYSTVQMQMKEGKSESYQSEYTVVQSRIKFFQEFWPIYAERVMNVNYTAVTDWLTQMKTPPGDAATQPFCLG